MKAIQALFVLGLIVLANAADKSSTSTAELPKPTISPVPDPTTAAPPSPPTPPPTPAPTPAPTPSPQPTDGTVKFELFKGENIEALGQFGGKISYDDEKAKQSFEIKFNNLTSLDSKSSYVKTSEINLTFNLNGQSNQSLTFILTSNNETYSLTTVSVVLTNGSDSKPFAYSGKWTGSMFNISSDHSYLCNNKQSFNFDANKNETSKVTFELVNFKIDAFRHSNSTDLRTSTECEADATKNDFVPIAVGASLIALVVIVLIAFVIGRKRSRRLAYESV